MMDDIPVKENSGGKPQATPSEDSSYRAVSLPSRLIPRDITLEEAVRRLRAMDGFTAVVAASNRNLDKLVKLAARMISDIVGDQAIITLLNSDRETYHVAAFYDPDPRALGLLKDVIDESVDYPRDQGWIASAIRDDRSMMLPGMTAEQATAAGIAAFTEYARVIGIAGILVVPIHSRSGILGAITVSRHAGGEPYTAQDQTLLEEIGDRLAVGVENFLHIASLRHELSIRRFATEALAESEQRFISVFRASPLGIKIMDLVGTILEANPAFEAMTGYAQGDLMAMHFYDIVHPEDVPRVQAVFNRIKTGDEPHARLEHRLIRRDGATIWVVTTFAGVQRASSDPTIALIFGITEDFTERKKAEAEINELREHLQGSIEMERLHLAQNLHDTPLQELYAVIYKLEELRVKADPAASQIMAGVIDDIQKTLNALRSTASELRPPALSRFGLEKAIRSYAQDFREKHPELRVHLSLARDQQALAESMRLVLFRVMQEALANVVRHAHATEVHIRFSYDAEEARIEIYDNGEGFAVPENWMNLVREGHYGLAGMAERVSAAGGSLVLESAPGASTTVRATLPCGPA